MQSIKDSEYSKLTIETKPEPVLLNELRDFKSGDSPRPPEQQQQFKKQFQNQLSELATQFEHNVIGCYR